MSNVPYLVSVATVFCALVYVTSYFSYEPCSLSFAVFLINYLLVDSSGQTSQLPSRNAESARTLPQYIAALSATLSAFAAGLVLGWTSPVLDGMEHGEFHKIPVTTDQMGWIGSFATLGAMTMCIPTGFICDLLGRRKTLLLLIIPFVLGWTLIMFAHSVLMIYFGRLITGMAVGACCVAAPLYTSEIAQKEIRGALGSYFQLMITSGIFIAYLAGKYMCIMNFTIFCSVVPFIFLLTFIFQPESPIYYLKRGLYGDAHTAMLQLRGESYDVNAELIEIEGVLKERNQVSVSLVQTLRLKSIRKALFIALMLMMFQQLSGINIIILYSSDIFAATSINFDANSATIIVGAFQAVATLASSLLVDRLGRRILLIISGLIMSLSSAALALYFFFKCRERLDDHLLADIGFVPIVSVCAFVIVFSVGFGPIPWIYTSEIFPSEIRSLAASLSGTFNWFLAFLITKFYLPVKDEIGEDTMFYFFAVVCVISALFVYFVVPETKGKTAEEIQEELG